MAEFIQFIPVVSAQNLDGVAQPTFGNITVTGGGGTTSTILLSSDKSSVNVGETFKVKVEIKTNSLSITEYKVVISFDRSALTVIDQDTTSQGTQIKLLDEIFTIDDPSKNNTVSTSGVITFDAKTSSGNSFQVNKDVAEITFQAQAAGTPVIKVVQGANSTQLIRSNGTTLPFTTNELTVLSSIPTSTDVTPQTPVDTTGNNTNTGGSGTTTNVTSIPNTALKDDIAQASGLFLGVFFIATGFMLAKNKLFTKQKSSQRDDGYSTI